jgi:CYTH domain-containing protein
LEYRKSLKFIPVEFIYQKFIRLGEKNYLWEARMADTSNSNIEIEARFLVCGDSWRAMGNGIEIYQGYLTTGENMAIRIRFSNEEAILTIKGKTKGLSRKEFEFSLHNTPTARLAVKEFCPHPIQKIRHKIAYGEFLWEIDEYQGENEGLVVAEVEFEHEADYQRMMDLGKPPWAGKEITHDAWLYTNARLTVRPFSMWSAEEKKDMLNHTAGRAPDCLNRQ